MTDLNEAIENRFSVLETIDHEQAKIIKESFAMLELQIKKLAQSLKLSKIRETNLYAEIIEAKCDIKFFSEKAQNEYIEKNQWQQMALDGVNAISIWKFIRLKSAPKIQNGVWKLFCICMMAKRFIKRGWRT